MLTSLDYPANHKTFTGTKPCGCTTLLLPYNHNWQEQIDQVLARWQNLGYTVDTTTWEKAVEKYCKCCQHDSEAER